MDDNPSGIGDCSTAIDGLNGSNRSLAITRRYIESQNPITDHHIKTMALSMQ